MNLFEKKMSLLEKKLYEAKGDEVDEVIEEILMEMVKEGLLETRPGPPREWKLTEAGMMEAARMGIGAPPSTIILPEKTR